MKPQIKPRAVLLSKRANVFYLEHVRVMQKDDRVVYLTDTGADIEQFFNIPETQYGVLLSAMRERLVADRCGGEEASQFNSWSAFLRVWRFAAVPPARQDVSDPKAVPNDQYIQGWMRLWTDEAKPGQAAKQMLKASAMGIRVLVS
ncbi:MAG: hypothetical protein IPP10_15770 [Candidatus Competibacteraceae bacterium]|nr:hypothetical protein [Candidatus Competibacteraceae bacterium]